MSTNRPGTGIFRRLECRSMDGHWLDISIGELSSDENGVWSCLLSITPSSPECGWNAFEVPCSGLDPMNCVLVALATVNPVIHSLEQRHGLRYGWQETGSTGIPDLDVYEVYAVPPPGATGGEASLEPTNGSA